MIGEQPQITPMSHEELEQKVRQLERVLQKGLDPSQIGYRSITADKLRKVQVSSKAEISQGAPLAANSWSKPFTIGIYTTAGVGEGPNYIVTPFFDIYVDPINTSEDDLLTSNFPYPYSGGSPDFRDHFHMKTILRKATPPEIDTDGDGDLDSGLMYYTWQVYNASSTAHTYWVQFTVNILATQLTGGN